MTADFKSFGLLPKLEANVAELGFTTPTPIQAQSIAPLLVGRDLLGIAQTGTGKTAAFSLPLLQRLLSNKQKMRPGKCRSLILAPTRELASQIHKDIKTYSAGTGINAAVIFGGIKSHNQIRALKQGPDIVVATPGRLEDLINQGYCKLDQVSCLILDEADRMLDMGFIHSIRKIVKMLPKERQTMLFSATMPKTIIQLTSEFLRDPLKVEVTPESTTVERIQQQVVNLPIALKLPLLQQILRTDELNQAIIFSRTKRGAERLCRNLQKSNIHCEAIHGDKAQNARAKSLNEFKAGNLKILIATDVAARGIDAKGVSHVINYDMPMEPESYVHRIGRTGRAGRDGMAITFCTPEENSRLRNIEKSINSKLPTKNLAQLDWEELGFAGMDTTGLKAQAAATKNQTSRASQGSQGGSNSAPAKNSNGHGANRNSRSKVAANAKPSGHAKRASTDAKKKPLRGFKAKEGQVNKFRDSVGPRE